MSQPGGAQTRYRLGIDIGGTFTDFSAVETGSGRSQGLKVPTTAADPAAGIATGLTELRALGVDPTAVDYLVHGQTIALNSIIQRNGARIALLVTEGFRDVLELARLRLPVTWSFYATRPAPLVPRERVLPVRERILAGGAVATPLEDEECARVVTEVLRLRVEGVAICLLHSYANAVHEQQLADAFREAGVPVSCSSDLWPQMREYERALITAMNAFVQPPLAQYLTRLEQVLAEAGVPARPYITRSNGGIMTLAAARGEPVQTLLSGPASGVTGAAAVAAAAGFTDLLTLDMGGTSADVAVVEGGAIGYSHEERIGDFPLILPAVAISSIGAGGGSIAWLDGTGVLKVGPESAGSDPGPACYGRGAVRPALSDAFVVCGYLDPGHFAGGIDLDRTAAERALETLAEPLGLSVSETATAVVRVALANMYAEFAGVLDRRGLDPREFTLVAYGGAGPLVACLLAEEVNVRRVLVPIQPGTLCAQGALGADVMTDIVRTLTAPLAALDPSALRSALADPVERAERWLEREAPPLSSAEIRLAAELRYVGQAYEIEVPIEPPWLENSDLSPLAARFHELHERLYFHADPTAPIECVNLRVRAIGRLPRTPHPPKADAAPSTPATAGAREMVLGLERLTVAVYERPQLPHGARFAGPAIVQQADTTTLVPPGWQATVDGHANLVLEREAT